MDPIETVDVGNEQLAGQAGRGAAFPIIVLRPKSLMSRVEALVHAAWLVVLAEEEPGQFEKILEKVKRT